MKCNNKHCKYFEPAEKASAFDIPFLGYGKESGCKYPYCKLNGRKKRKRG